MPKKPRVKTRQSLNFTKNKPYCKCLDHLIWTGVVAYASGCGYQTDDDMLYCCVCQKCSLQYWESAAAMKAYKTPFFYRLQSLLPHNKLLM